MMLNLLFLLAATLLLIRKENISQTVKYQLLFYNLAATLTSIFSAVKKKTSILQHSTLSSTFHFIVDAKCSNQLQQVYSRSPGVTEAMDR